MQDLAFSNVGCERSSRKRDLVIMPRRVLRRFMRPMLFRLQDILKTLVQRHDHSDQNIANLQGAIAALRADIVYLQAHLPVVQDEIGALRQDLFQLTNSHKVVAQQAQTAIAIGWDEVAVVRRLAVIEEHVESLMKERSGIVTENRSILFPGHEQVKSQAS